MIFDIDYWKYFEGVSETNLNWKILEFENSDWLQGVGEIGYGDGKDLTVYNYLQYSNVSETQREYLEKHNLNIVN